MQVDLVRRQVQPCARSDCGVVDGQVGEAGDAAAVDDRQQRVEVRGPLDRLPAGPQVVADLLQDVTRDPALVVTPLAVRPGAVRRLGSDR
jgi:hypothetical protein